MQADDARDGAAGRHLGLGELPVRTHQLLRRHKQGGSDENLRPLRLVRRGKQASGAHQATGPDDLQVGFCESLAAESEIGGSAIARNWSCETISR